ncbi:hypothetical protein ASPVEDRAFT_351400 [Aspergillus versicolor CBS 583.65]|uniref:Uncharacterized protein n=1 Tax=Aspergillus versicolor CBS 583.65 TaxID=1036611 RepID=A0A1L9PZM9_ASPVE|nr:uncharacterized protein ASPVEDRAFT_351400 [Aspergillus versicolor CBS 583.65]OJJ06981.1 hypothetical protein ASPVEDRAFT_351400 [Aspergillus versicolor CBS 583.65]
MYMSEGVRGGVCLVPLGFNLALWPHTMAPTVIHGQGLFKTAFLSGHGSSYHIAVWDIAKLLLFDVEVQKSTLGSAGIMAWVNLPANRAAEWESTSSRSMQATLGSRIQLTEVICSGISSTPGCSTSTRYMK